MPERAATPQVPKLAARALSAIQGWTTPLIPSDYLELINPMWSTKELKARVVAVRPETHDTATIVLQPSRPWPGHRPGQYLRLGIDLGGRRHWRAYTITADPDHPRGHVSCTVKAVDDGLLSGHFVRKLKPGDILYLGDVEGEFGLPDPLPEKFLFVSAGSGITPIFAILRELDRRDAIDDAVHLYSMRTEDDFILGDRLADLDTRRDGYSLCRHVSSRDGRLTPERITELVPDWREREAYFSGPGDMLDALKEFWKDAGLEQRVHMERFQPRIGGDEVEPGQGGTIHFRVTDFEAECDGSTPILVAGEEAGGTLPFGCRMGICHTCQGRLAEGAVRDLRSGEIIQDRGVMVRTCISCPEGHVEIEL
ncbi:MAG: ferredoxin reductase [Jatrophihabitans sp.]|uniref:ferredoxin reductase n=1 Tax=Jatrophihabitans sp. TaxID=1932789 RepID=UPI003F7E95B6